MTELPDSAQVRFLSELSDQICLPVPQVLPEPQDSLDEFCQWKDVIKPRVGLNLGKTIPVERLSERKLSRMGTESRPQTQAWHKRTQSMKVITSGDLRKLSGMWREKAAIEPPPQLVIKIRERMREEMPRLPQPASLQPLQCLRRREISSIESTPKLRKGPPTLSRGAGLVAFRPIPARGTIPIHSSKSRAHSKTRHSVLSTPGRSRVQSP